MLAIVAVATMAGCTIKHPIAKDYDQYLAKNKGEVVLPKSAIEANRFFNSDEAVMISVMF